MLYENCPFILCPPTMHSLLDYQQSEPECPTGHNCRAYLETSFCPHSTVCFIVVGFFFFCYDTHKNAKTNIKVPHVQLIFTYGVGYGSVCILLYILTQFPWDKEIKGNLCFWETLIIQTEHPLDTKATVEKWQKWWKNGSSLQDTNTFKKEKETVSPKTPNCQGKI